MLHPKRLDNEASSLEQWKNPLTSMQKRLAIADSLISSQSALIDRLEKCLQPKHHDNWIIEFNESVFVVFDPTTDGSDIIGATRTLDEAKQLLDRCAV